MKRVIIALFAAAAVTMFSTAGADTGTRDRIGVYDSRILAYAYFQTPHHQNQLDTKVQELNAAKAIGNTAEAKRLEAILRDEQKRAHRQVFSSDPIPNVLAEVAHLLPAIQQEAGVTALISKWDKAALRKHRGVEQVDLTDRLAAEFHPGDKQQKVIEELKRARPVSRRKAERH